MKNMFLCVPGIIECERVYVCGCVSVCVSVCGWIGLCGFCL